MRDENNEIEHNQDQYREETVKAVVYCIAAFVAVASTVTLFVIYHLTK